MARLRTERMTRAQLKSMLLSQEAENLPDKGTDKAWVYSAPAGFFVLAVSTGPNTFEVSYHDECPCTGEIDDY